MEHGTDIDQLARDLRRFEIETNRYFAGALELPPLAFQDELSSRIRELRAQPMTAVADRFRLNGLTDRFNSIRELFQRRLREHEEGGRERPPAEDGREPDPRVGVVVEGAPSQPAIKALYEALYADRDGKPASLTAFRRYLARELDAIRTRTGCVGVRFRVESGADRPRLKALPIYMEES